MNSLGLSKQPMKLALLNLVPPVPYTYTNILLSYQIFSNCIKYFLSYLQHVVLVHLYDVAPAGHHQLLALVELEVDCAAHVGHVAAEVEQVGARHRDHHRRHVRH